MRRVRSRDGVFGIGLALAPATLAVGSVHLDDTDPLGLQVPGEARSVAAGAFDADELTGPKSLSQPNSFL